MDPLTLRPHFGFPKINQTRNGTVRHNLQCRDLLGEASTLRRPALF
jgi:hypothetical protein